MTIMDAIKKGMIELKNSNIESPKLKSRLLMQYVLNQTRQYIIVNDLNQISKEDEERYFVGISKLRADVPLEHITHQREFLYKRKCPNSKAGYRNTCRRSNKYCKKN